VGNRSVPQTPLRSFGQQETDQPWWRNPQWIIVGITAIYAIFAGLQWVAIRRQARFTEQNVRYLTMLERPYIFIGDMEVKTLPGIPFKVVFTLRNNGRTAARILRRGMAISYNIPLSRIPDYSLCTIQPGLSILGPRTASPPIEYWLAASDEAGFQEVLTAKNANRCFFWGFVDYHDLLGEPHTTKFGFQFLSEQGFVPVDNEQYNRYT
jgi:hypothetical protein